MWRRALIWSSVLEEGCVCMCKKGLLWLVRLIIYGAVAGLWVRGCGSCACGGLAVSDRLWLVCSWRHGYA